MPPPARIKNSKSSLQQEWNRTGKHIRGVFYKASTVNLLFGTLGLLLLSFAVIGINSGVTATYGTSKFQCGSVLSPDRPGPSEGESLADLFNYTYTGSDSASIRSEKCASALGEKQSNSTFLAFYGAVVLIATIGIAASRDAENTPWGPLSRERASEFPNRGAPRQTPSAGWYPDQENHEIIRWFDGAKWTEATLPREDSPDIQ